MKIYKPAYPCLILALFAPFFSVHSKDEPPVSLEIRTFGWGIQGNYQGRGLDAELPVFMSQFSDSVRYSGPVRLDLFFAARDGLDDVGVDEGLTGNEGSQGRETATQTVPERPSASVNLPMDSDRVLLIFTRSEGGRLRVAVLDDSLTEPAVRSAHFYNLTSLELLVRAFEENQLVAPAKQALWFPADGREVSPLKIAIRDPEARLLYSSRFRLRDERRMVIFARPDNTPQGRARDQPPQIQVLTLTLPLENDSQQEGIQDMEGDLGDAQ